MSKGIVNPTQVKSWEFSFEGHLLMGCLSTDHPFSISGNSNALGMFVWQTEWDSGFIQKCSQSHSDPWTTLRVSVVKHLDLSRAGFFGALKMTRTRVKFLDSRRKKRSHKHQTAPSGYSGEKWGACKRAGTSYAYEGGCRSGWREVRFLTKGHVPG